MLGNIMRLTQLLSKLFNRLVFNPLTKSSLNSCGKKVKFGPSCKLINPKNVSIGDSVFIGANSVLYSTNARIIFGSHIMVASDTKFITGDHETRCIGKYMDEICESDKPSELDKDIIVEDDVWIGSSVIVLKGVTIREGCVIGAGSVLTHSTEEYGVYVGNPARKIRSRFSESELLTHLIQINAANSERESITR